MKKKTLQEEVADIKQKMNLKTTPKKNNYEYGCAMLYFSLPQMAELHELIDQNDLYIADDNGGYGLETEPHVTLLFGLHSEVTTEDVTNVMNQFNYGDCILHNASLFKNPLYDVLKFDVRYPTTDSAFLHKANAELSNFPHTTDYPDYHPHCTIAYLKPGMGEKYVKELVGHEYTVIPEYGVYSKPDGGKDNIKIK